MKNLLLSKNANFSLVFNSSNILTLSEWDFTSRILENILVETNVKTSEVDQKFHVME